MAAAFMRRSVATAGLAVLATVASPLAGVAFAADPALTAGTFSPADGDTVAANRPPISVVYNTELNRTKTTIAVTDVTTATPAAVPCAQAFTDDSKTVGCALSSDLTDGHSYKVAVHAENADSSSKLDESATWTIDIPSVTVTSPAEGSTVAVAQVLQLTYDEQIDATHATASLVNGFGTHVPGSISVVKSTPGLGGPGPCPDNPCILKFSAAQTLPEGTYTANFHVDGVTAGVPSASDNPNAFANTVLHFSVNKVKPSIAPQNVVAPANITQANVAKVPFSGYAQPGFNVYVAIYNETCAQNPICGGSDEGDNAEDGLGKTLVANCEDSDAISVNNIRLCPFNLTVDDSNGCDTGAAETSCGGGDTVPGDTADNQWYAFSSSPAGQVPGAANPTTNPHINRDTTAPSAPDNTATGYVTNNSPSTGLATVTVSATDSFEAPTGPDAYVAQVSDEFGDAKQVTLAPSAGNLNATFPMPSGIYDGSLTIAIAAADSLGNVSDFVTAQTPIGKSQAKDIVALAPVDPANHTDSMDSSNGSTYDLASLPASATPAKVGLPSSVTVHFNEPITLTVPDNSATGTPALPKARLCVLAPGGICETNLGVGTLTNPTSDRTTLTWTAPDGFGADLPNGTYTIAAFAPAADCPTRQPAGTYPGCETSGGSENDPTSWPSLATFTVDKAAPAIQTFGVSPSVIRASAVKGVTISGTSDPDTREVQVSIKSSAGGPARLLSMAVPAPTDGAATSVAWTFFPVDLSTVRDGTLTISAIAIDDAGNKTADPGSQITAVLKAHISTLTERVSSSRIVYGHIVQVSGRLVDANGAAIRRATVVVRPRFGDGSYGAATKGTTDSTGHWGVLVGPAHNARWYASYAGSTTTPLHDAAAIHTAATQVKVAIAFTSPKNRAKVGSPVVLKGKVGPNKHGKYVSIYRHTSSGNKLLGRARLDSHSHWSFKLSLPRGTVKLFAKIGKTAGNIGNKTSILTLTH